MAAHLAVFLVIIIMMWAGDTSWEKHIVYLWELVALV